MIEHEDLDNIDAAILKGAFEKSGLTVSQLASNLELYNGSSPDISGVKKLLGVGRKADAVPYDWAVKIVEACHYDPVDYGL